MHAVLVVISEVPSYGEGVVVNCMLHVILSSIQVKEWLTCKLQMEKSQCSLSCPMFPKS